MTKTSKMFLSMLLLAGASACIDRRSKEHLFSREKVCDGLWKEKYIVSSGGAWGGDTYAAYISDFTRFRKYLGTHDRDGGFTLQCSGDSIRVVQYQYKEQNGQPIVLQDEKLSISKLKQELKME